MSPSTKKFIFTVFYLLVFIFILVLLFPSFFADLFSPAELPPPAPEPLLFMGDPEILALQAGRAVIVLRVKNLNADFGLINFDYEVEISDGFGRLLERLPGASFVYPAEEKYIVLPEVVTPAGEIAGAEVRFLSGEWKPSQAMRRPEVVLENTRASWLRGQSVSVTGDLVNGEPGTLDEAVILVFLRDSFGFNVFASRRLERNIGGFERKSFAVIFPADRVFDDKLEISLTKVFVYAR